VDLWKVVVGILLFGNVDLLSDIIALSVDFAPLDGQCPSFSICFLVYLSLLHTLCSQHISIGLRLVAGLPK
jgi:hypothetical protein